MPDDAILCSRKRTRGESKQMKIEKQDKDKTPWKIVVNEVETPKISPRFGKRRDGPEKSIVRDKCKLYQLLNPCANATGDRTTQERTIPAVSLFSISGKPVPELAKCA